MDRNNKKAIFLIIYITAVLWGYSYVSVSGRESGPDNYVFLIFPTACILISKVFEYVLNKYCRGSAVPVVISIVTRLAWGLAGFFFLYFMPEGSSYKQAAICVLVFSFVRTLFLLLPLFEGYIILNAVSRTFLYVIQGCVLSWLFKVLWAEGVWDIGIKVHASEIVFYGYTIVALCSLLSILVLSENNYFANMGKWFGKDYTLKLVISLTLVLLIRDVFESVTEKFAGQYVKFEWLFVFLVLVVLLIVFLMKTNSFWTVSIHPEIKKHLLDIKYIRDNEMTVLSQYITEFIEYGDKTRLLTYLAFLSLEMNISVEAAGNMAVKPLLEYSDMEKPRFSLKREMDAINEINKENRRIVVQHVIDSLKNYGG